MGEQTARDADGLTDTGDKPRGLGTVTLLTPGMAALTIAWVSSLFLIFPDPAATFSNGWPLILVGVAGAVIGNATAIGGGLIFIPYLTLVMNVPALVAFKLAIATQSVGMTSGAVAWLRRRVVPLHMLKLTLPGLLVGATIASVVIRPSPALIKSLFGPVSIVVGTLALIRAKRVAPEIVVTREMRRTLPFAALVGGMVSGWVAIGEGEIVAAVAMLRFGLEPSASVGLGVVLLSVTSIYLTTVHGIFLGGVPWEMVFFTSIGVLWGGRLGAMAMQRLPSERVKKAFGVISIADGALFIAQSAGLFQLMK